MAALGADDWDDAAALGTNVIRLVTTWSAWEPQRDRFERMVGQPGDQLPRLSIRGGRRLLLQRRVTGHAGNKNGRLAMIGAREGMTALELKGLLHHADSRMSEHYVSALEEDTRSNEKRVQDRIAEIMMVEPKPLRRVQ